MKNLFLFERKCNDFSYIQFKLKIETKLNLSNFASTPKNKIKSLFSIKNQPEFLRYRFELLKSWIKNNATYTKAYVNGLDMIVNKLFLTNELNAYENEYINHYNGVVFAKERNLKNLIIEFRGNDNENFFYKYSGATMYKLNGDKLETVCKDGEVFISTKRILVYKNHIVYPINFEQIINYRVTSSGLCIEADYGTFYIRTVDDYINYVSFERILRLMHYHI